jgi:hypothetical protein
MGTQSTPNIRAIVCCPECGSVFRKPCVVAGRTVSTLIDGCWGFSISVGWRQEAVQFWILVADL